MSCAGPSSGGEEATTLSFSLGGSASRSALGAGTTVYIGITGDYKKTLVAQVGEQVVVENVPVGAEIGVIAAASDSGAGIDYYLASCPSYTVQNGANTVTLSMQRVELHGGATPSDISLSIYAMDGPSRSPLTLPDGFCSWKAGSQAFTEAGSASSVTMERVAFVNKYGSSGSSPGQMVYNNFTTCIVTVGSWSASLDSSEVTADNS